MWTDEFMKKLAEGQSAAFKTDLEDTNRIQQDEAPGPEEDDADDYGDESSDDVCCKEASEILEFVGLQKEAGGVMNFLRRFIPKASPVVPIAAEAAQKGGVPLLSRHMPGWLSAAAMAAPVAAVGGSALLDSGTAAANRAMAEGTKPPEAPAAPVAPAAAAGKPEGTPPADSASLLKNVLLYGGVPLGAYGLYSLLRGNDKEEEKPRRYR